MIKAPSVDAEILQPLGLMKTRHLRENALSEMKRFPCRLEFGSKNQVWKRTLRYSSTHIFSYRIGINQLHSPQIVNMVRKTFERLDVAK